MVTKQYFSRESSSGSKELLLSYLIMKKYLTVGAIVLGLIVLVLGTKFLQEASADVSGKSIIPIGGIMILSGEGATWGEASRNGMELAIQEVNKRGGVNGKQLKGIYEDDGSDPQKTISAFKKLTEVDAVEFIIGPNWSKLGLAVAPLVDEAQVVMISPSLGVREFNEASTYLFNTWQHDDILSANLAEVVYARGHRNVALFGAKDEWVQVQTLAFKKRFEELGGTVARVYEPTTETTDERTEIQKVIADSTIDALVMTTDGYSLSILTARQLRELGSDLPIFNITVDKKILAECGTCCDGMVFPTSLTPTKEFEAKYQKAYNREVEIGSDSAYDAIMMLAEAMEATNSEDPELVKAYLAGITTYTGASGTLVSDGKRAFTKDYVLKESQGGVPVTVTK